MHSCTLDASWQPVLALLLPPVGALLSAIALWVAARARSISVDAQSTSQGAVALSLLGSERLDASESRQAARDQRKP